MSRQGAREDIDALCKEITVVGKSVEQIMLEGGHHLTLARYMSYAMKLEFAYRKQNAMHFRKIEVHVYHGVTGTGKTRAATEEHAAEGYYIMSKDSQSLWYDGYNAEPVLIWDDFHWDQVHLTFLLRLLDGYALKLPVKGGFGWAAWKKVVITTNLPDNLWYPLAEGVHQDALQRRITHRREFN